MFDFLKFGRGETIPPNLTAEDDSPLDGEVFSLERLQAQAAELADDGQTHNVLIIIGSAVN